MTQDEAVELRKLLLVALSSKAYREAEGSASVGGVLAGSPGEGGTPAVNSKLRDVLQLRLVDGDELNAAELLAKGKVNLGDDLREALSELDFIDLDEKHLPGVLDGLRKLFPAGPARLEEGQLTTTSENVEVNGRVIYCYLRHARPRSTSSLAKISPRLFRTLP